MVLADQQQPVDVPLAEPDLCSSLCLWPCLCLCLRLWPSLCLCLCLCLCRHDVPKHLPQ